MCAVLWGVIFERTIAGGKYTGLNLPLKVLAPTVFVVAVMGVMRGLFQGKGTMIPTAISQVIEQIVNAVVSIYAAYSLMSAHNLSLNLAGYGAAGGTMGTLFWRCLRMHYFDTCVLVVQTGAFKVGKRDRRSASDSSGYIYKLIILTAVPIILSQTVYQISGIIDYSVLGAIQAKKRLG